MKLEAVDRPVSLPAEVLTTPRILEITRPHVRRIVPLSSPEARRLRAEKRRTVLGWSMRLAWEQFRDRRRLRSPEFTERLYGDAYVQTVEEFDAGLDDPRRANSFWLGREYLMFLPPNGLFAIYLETIAEVIRALQPDSVCEVGFGSGKNLIYLAPRFPKVDFSGYELTASGLSLARRLQAGPMPPNLAKLVGPVDDAGKPAIARIALRQGDAGSLPAPDKSVDLTFTVLALEQMWPILPEALAEIRRITRRYVVFLEAFRDVNDWLGVTNLWARNYFRATVRDVERAGFRRLALLRNVPNKHTFATGVLVAEVDATRRGSA